MTCSCFFFFSTHGVSPGVSWRLACSCPSCRYLSKSSNCSLGLAMLASAPSTFASIANANPGCDMLNYGSPESVGMLSKTPRDMVSNLMHFTETHNLGRRLYNRTVPVGPGDITIVANRGTIVSYSVLCLWEAQLWAGVNV